MPVLYFVLLFSNPWCFLVCFFQSLSCNFIFQKSLIESPAKLRPKSISQVVKTITSVKANSSVSIVKLCLYSILLFSPNRSHLRRSCEQGRFSVMPSSPELPTWSETGSTTWRHTGGLEYPLYHVHLVHSYHSTCTSVCLCIGYVCFLLYVFPDVMWCVCLLQAMLCGNRAGWLADAAELLCSHSHSSSGHVAGAAGGRSSQPRWARTVQ